VVCADIFVSIFYVRRYASPDTKGVISWLIDLKKKRDASGATTYFLCGNHDFSMAAYLGTEWLPSDDSKIKGEDMDSNTNPGYTSGHFKHKVEGGMHYQGRRWGGCSIYNADSTFSSYGVKWGFTTKHREAFIAAVPEAHKLFLKSLDWVCDIEIGFGPGRLIACHAGLNAKGSLKDQLEGLKKRQLFNEALLEKKGRYFSFSARDAVTALHPELKSNNKDKLPAGAYLVSGHHGYREVTAKGYRIICDRSGGYADELLEAVILPSQPLNFVNDVRENTSSLSRKGKKGVGEEEKS